MKVTTKLYKFQERKAVEAIDHLHKHRAAAFLMQLGTGKTLTSLSTASRLPGLNGLLIIPPKALIPTWLDELDKHTDGKYVSLVWDASKVKTKKFQRAVSQFLTSPDFKIMICNVETFQTSNKHFFDTIRYYLDKYRIMTIVDESGKIKNYKAQRTKNLIKHTDKSAYLAILTGTEISNSVEDLFSQFEFLVPDFWKLYKRTVAQRFYIFRAKYMILKTMEIGGRKFEMSVGVKPNKLQEIYDRVDQVSVRALKGEVLDLPDKIYQQIKIEPTSEQRRIYDELKAFMYTEYKDHELTVESKISLFTRFRQIAGGFFPESGEYIGSNKLDFIREDTEDYQGKVIIWAAFRAEIEWLHKQLKDCSVCYVGGQTTAERQEVLHRFKNDDSIKFLIANPQTAAYGLNLQFAQLNYYYSNTLPPEFRNQSEGRTDRNGQIASPVYKDLLTSGTVDSKILANLKQKIDLSTCFQHMEKSDFFSQI